MQTKRISLYIKYFLIILTSILGIIVVAIFLRAACFASSSLTATKISSTYASSGEYVKITANTPLYKTSDTSSIVLELPKTYYARLLSSPNSGSDLIKVKYGSCIGFMQRSTAEIVDSVPEGHKENWSPEAKTESSFGTYLRTSPTTTETNNILTLIEANTPLKIVGFITGECPTDGTTTTWYLVDYEAGPTTISRGYVYGERLVLSESFSEQQPTFLPQENPSQNLATNQTANADTTPITDTQNITGNINFSPAIKWLLIILFSSVALIIFFLLLSPNKKSSTVRNKKRQTPDPVIQKNTQPFMASPENPNIKTNIADKKHKKTKPCKITPISPLKLPEFSSMLEFSSESLPPTQLNRAEEKLKSNKMISKYFSPQDSDYI